MRISTHQCEIDYFKLFYSFEEQELSQLSKRVDQEDVESHIKPALNNLANDKDIDVCYFAKDALAVC